VRQALRQRPALCATGSDTTVGSNVESFFRVGPQSFYVCGWIASVDAPLRRVTAVSPEGCRVELLELIFRHYRPDLDGLYSAVSEDDDVRPFGFACYFETVARAFSRRAG